ncbi:MAG: aspartate aminotransferase family protein [Nitriliruptoraceae bacterium]|nr:aspartate aminotransferase family protein [Nitriliruptoraceae bacterium]
MTQTGAQLGDGNLWLHFTRTSDWIGDSPSIPVLDRGEGCYVWDTDGKRYFDGLSALFCAQIGYGHQELIDAASEQMAKLPFATNWSWAHQPAVDLAGRLAELFPGDLDHFFFVNSGSEAVESAMKLAIQYHRTRGEDRWKFISRNYAYHGTTFGALGMTGLPGLRKMFEPLRPGHYHAPNTNEYRCKVSAACAPCDLTCARSFEQIIEAEGPDQIAAIFVEPVQNAGGCFTPPDGYMEEVRAICDKYGILMVSDEVICAFGRLGTWTGAEKYGYLPDILTFAKGVTSAYQPLGGLGFRSHIAEVLQQDTGSMYLHGSTWGGHPVAAAVALANLDLFEKHGVLENVQANGDWFGEQLWALYDKHHIVGDVRGTGYFWAMELVKDRDHKIQFDDDETERLLRGFLSNRLMELGLICRADDRDEPVIQLSPPLVSTREQLTEVIQILDTVLGEATVKMTEES